MVVRVRKDARHAREVRRWEQARPEAPARSQEAAAAAMRWVDSLTPEQRALVGEYGPNPVRIALGLGYTAGPTLLREVRDAAAREEERFRRRAIGADEEA